MPILNDSKTTAINTIKKLVESGADIDEPYGHHRETLLHYAARSRWLNVVQYLVENGADINKLDKYGGTPLCDAACEGFMKIVKYLLSKGADKDIYKDDGKNAEHCAFEYGHHDVAEYIANFELMPTKGVHLDN